MSDVIVTGAAGAGGAPGDPGLPGLSAAAHNYGASGDDVETAKATGGQGGAGGDSLGGEEGGDGGAGGPAEAIVSFARNTASTVTGQATAGGGGGGFGGYSPPGASTAQAGEGGDATAQVSVANPGGVAIAEAQASGGFGGGGYWAGSGGVAHDVSASAEGSSAIAVALQRGGAGGDGPRAYGTAGGAGASSTLADAVFGTASAGGYILLRQTAIGGAGGEGSWGWTGAGGAASSQLTFADTIASVLHGYTTAEGGAAGLGRGTSAYQDGGAAASSIDLSGPHEVHADSHSYGGAGGRSLFGGSSSGPFHYGGVGSDGGAANASASATTIGVEAVSANAGAYGGTGGRSDPEIDGDGGAGGSATAFASAEAQNATDTLASAVARAAGGAGGSCEIDYRKGEGDGGYGGVAHDTTASAMGFNARAEVVQIGGAGGAVTAGVTPDRSSQVEGGRGAESRLIDAVTGASKGGYLKLIQTAEGGRGGDVLGFTYGGDFGGYGGSAISSLTFDDAINAVHASHLYGTSTALGGAGGADGGTGGDANAWISLAGPQDIVAISIATGGDGGAGFFSGAGYGGSAYASASASSTGAGRSTDAEARATGGMSGGDASGYGGGARANAVATGAGPTTANANAIGGDGLGVIGGYYIGGVNAEATATSTDLGGAGIAIASASAIGGAGSGGPSNMPAGANASASTAAGQLASATAVATGAEGLAHSIASTGGAEIVSKLVTDAQAPITNLGTSVASTAVAGALPAFDGGAHNAYAFGTMNPMAAGVSALLAGNPVVGAPTALGASGASVFGAGVLGAFNEVAGDDQHYETSAAFTLDTTGLDGHLVVGLVGDQVIGDVGDAADFTALTLIVTVGGSEQVHESFSSLAAAHAFFTDHVLDLGEVAHGPSLQVAVSLELDTHAAGFGYGAKLLLGTTGPPSGATPGADALQGAAGADRLDGLAGGDTVTGLAGDDVLRGGAGRDRLDGGAGDDVLHGGRGHDTLIGGAGHDKLTGGDGGDLFVFGPAAPGDADKIFDFTAGQDRLAFHAADLGLAAGPLPAADFVAGASAADPHAEFVYDAAARSLSWDPDGTGAEAPILVATFATAVSLSPADLVVLP
jgi:hypothetical protein